MIEIEFRCPHCDATLLAPESAPADIECPGCARSCPVPRLRGLPPTPLAPASDPLPPLLDEARQRLSQKRAHAEAQRQNLLRALRSAEILPQGPLTEILLSCHHCAASLVAPLSFADIEIACPACGEPAEIPNPIHPEFGQHSAAAAPSSSAAPLHRVSARDILYLREDNSARSVPLASSPAPALSPIRLRSRTEPAPVPAPVPSSADDPDPSDSDDPSARRPGGGALKRPPVRSDPSPLVKNRAPAPLAPAPAQANLSRILIWSAVVLLIIVALASNLIYKWVNTEEPEIIATARPSTLIGQLAQGGDAQASPVSLSPTEQEEAKSAVIRYIRAPSWKDRLTIVRHPSRVFPLMQDYYLRNPDAPLVYHDITLHWAGTVGPRFLVLISATDEGFKDHFFTLERVRNAFLIDWEVLVEYNPLSWADLQRSKPTTPSAYRVSLSSASYYNYQFADPAIFQCYKISGRTEFTGIYGYLRRDSDAFRRLDLNETSPARLAIVTLRYPDSPQTDKMVEITDFLQNGWIINDTLPDPAPSAAPAPPSETPAPPSGTPAPPSETPPPAEPKPN